MKTSISVSAIAMAIAASLPAIAAVPIVDRVGVPAKIRCSVSAEGLDVMAMHADKIIYRITGALVAAQPADQPAVDKIVRNSKLDIKVLDNPEHIADLKGKVLTFMKVVDNQADRDAITIDEVQYAMVCPSVPN